MVVGRYGRGRVAKTSHARRGTATRRGQRGVERWWKWHVSPRGDDDAGPSRSMSVFPSLHSHRWPILPLVITLEQSQIRRTAIHLTCHILYVSTIASLSRVDDSRQQWEDGLVQYPIIHLHY